MEGAEPGVVPPGMTQFDTGLGDEVDDVYLGFDLIDGGHADELWTLSGRFGKYTGKMAALPTIKDYMEGLQNTGGNCAGPHYKPQIIL